MMQIDNKFDIGQEVYFIGKVKPKNICPACNGKRHVVIDGSKFYCKKCDGDGWIWSRNKIYQVEGKRVITMVKTYTNDTTTEVKYNLGNLKDVVEKYLFIDGEEAIAECDKLNNPELEEVK